MPRRARVLLPGMSLHLFREEIIAQPVSTQLRIIFSIWLYWQSKQKSMGALSMLGA